MSGGGDQDFEKALEEIERLREQRTTGQVDARPRGPAQPGPRPTDLDVSKVREDWLRKRRRLYEAQGVDPRQAELDAMRDWQTRDRTDLAEEPTLGERVSRAVSRRRVGELAEPGGKPPPTGYLGSLLEGTRQTVRGLYAPVGRLIEEAGPRQEENRRILQERGVRGLYEHVTSPEYEEPGKQAAAEILTLMAHTDRTYVPGEGLVPTESEAMRDVRVAGTALAGLAQQAVFQLGTTGTDRGERIRRERGLEGRIQGWTPGTGRERFVVGYLTRIEQGSGTMEDAQALMRGFDVTYESNPYAYSLGSIVGFAGEFLPWESPVLWAAGAASRVARAPGKLTQAGAELGGAMSRVDGARKAALRFRSALFNDGGIGLGRVAEEGVADALGDGEVPILSGDVRKNATILAPEMYDLTLEDLEWGAQNGIRTLAQLRMMRKAGKPRAAPPAPPAAAGAPPASPSPGAKAAGKAPPPKPQQPPRGAAAATGATPPPGAAQGAQAPPPPAPGPVPTVVSRGLGVPAQADPAELGELKRVLTTGKKIRQTKKAGPQEVDATLGDVRSAQRRYKEHLAAGGSPDPDIDRVLAKVEKLAQPEPVYNAAEVARILEGREASPDAVYFMDADEVADMVAKAKPKEKATPRVVPKRASPPPEVPEGDLSGALPDLSEIPPPAGWDDWASYNAHEKERVSAAELARSVKLWAARIADNPLTSRVYGAAGRAIAQMRGDHGVGLIDNYLLDRIEQALTGSAPESVAPDVIIPRGDVPVASPTPGVRGAVGDAPPRNAALGDVEMEAGTSVAKADDLIEGRVPADVGGARPPEPAPFMAGYAPLDRYAMPPEWERGEDAWRRFLYGNMPASLGPDDADIMLMATELLRRHGFETEAKLIEKGTPAAARRSIPSPFLDVPKKAKPAPPTVDLTDPQVLDAIAAGRKIPGMVERPSPEIVELAKQVQAELAAKAAKKQSDALEEAQALADALLEKGVDDVFDAGWESAAADDVIVIREFPDAGTVELLDQTEKGRALLAGLRRRLFAKAKAEGWARGPKGDGPSTLVREGAEAPPPAREPDVPLGPDSAEEVVVGDEAAAIARELDELDETIIEPDPVVEAPRPTPAKGHATVDDVRTAYVNEHGKNPQAIGALYNAELEAVELAASGDAPLVSGARYLVRQWDGETWTVSDLVTLADAVKLFAKRRVPGDEIVAVGSGRLLVEWSPKSRRYTVGYGEHTRKPRGHLRIYTTETAPQEYAALTKPRTEGADGLVDALGEVNALDPKGPSALKGLSESERAAMLTAASKARGTIGRQLEAAGGKPRVHGGLPKEWGDAIRYTLFGIPARHRLAPLTEVEGAYAKLTGEAVRMRQRTILGDDHLVPLAGNLMVTRAEALTLSRRWDRLAKATGLDDALRGVKELDANGNVPIAQDVLDRLYRRTGQDHLVGQPATPGKLAAVHSHALRAWAGHSARAEYALRGNRTLTHRLLRALDKATQDPVTVTGRHETRAASFVAELRKLVQPAKVYSRSSARLVDSLSRRLGTNADELIKEWRTLKKNAAPGTTPMQLLEALMARELVDVHGMSQHLAGPAQYQVALAIPSMKLGQQPSMARATAQWILANDHLDTATSELLQHADDLMVIKGVQRWAKRTRRAGRAYARDVVAAYMPGLAVPRHVSTGNLQPDVLDEVLADLWGGRWYNGTPGSAPGIEKALRELAPAQVSKVQPEEAAWNLLLQLRARRFMDEALEELVDDGLVIPFENSGGVAPRIRGAVQSLLKGTAKWEERLPDGTVRQMFEDFTEGEINTAMHWLRRNGLDHLLGSGMDLPYVGRQANRVFEEGAFEGAMIPPDVQRELARARMYGMTDSSASLLNRNASTAGGWAHTILVQWPKIGQLYGWLIPNVGYTVQNLLQVPLMMYMTVGPQRTGRAIMFGVKHPAITIELMRRMRGKARYADNVVAARAPEGVLTLEQFEQEMGRFGIDTSFARSEMHEKYVDEIMRSPEGRGALDLLRSGRVPVKDALSWMQQAILDINHETELWFRVGTYVSARMDGMPPARAAELARSALYDYATLTDWERTFGRIILPYYAFLRKSIDANLYALAKHPERIGAMLRLQRDQADVWGLTEEERLSLRPRDLWRLGVGMNRDLLTYPGERVDAYHQGRLTLTAPNPAIAGIQFFEAVVTALTGDMESSLEAGQELLGQTHWLIQAGFQAASGIAPTGADLRRSVRPYEAPAILLENPLLGPVFQRLFDAQPDWLEDTDPATLAVRPSLESGRYYWVAGQRTPEEVSFGPTRRAFGRAFLATYRTYLGRNTGQAQALARALSFGRLEPRAGLTPTDEMLTILGFTTRSIEDSNVALHRAVEQELRKASESSNLTSP